MDLTESDKFNLGFEAKATVQNASLREPLQEKSSSIFPQLRQQENCDNDQVRSRDVRKGVALCRMELVAEVVRQENNCADELKEYEEPKILADQLKGLGFVVNEDVLVAPDDMVLTPVQSPQSCERYAEESERFLPTSPLRKGRFSFSNV